MRRLLYTWLALSFLTLQQCDISDFGDTNVNPETTVNPVPAALLTNVLTGLGTPYQDCAFYCQYFSETMYSGSSTYSSNMWSPMGVYTSLLFDLQYVINMNSDDGTKVEAEIYGENENQIAIARILKAYLFWTVTDMTGDIPYSEALKGKPDVKYDTQESIYKDLIKELAEAVAQFKTGALVKPVKGDIVYNGDLLKWKRFANSLRMLMALNLSKRYPGISDYSAVQFRAALAEASGSIESNSYNFQLNYPGGIFNNPIYGWVGGNIGESETLVSLLLDSLGGDPRQSIFGTDRNGNPTSVGVPYGRNREFIDPWTQQHPALCYPMAPHFRSQTSPFFIIKASSVLLARAEAADRGWTTEDVSALYQAGISSSFSMWGLPGPDAGYFSKPKVALGPAGTNLKQIATQQYLAYYPVGLHGWNTWRRTGWPVLYPAPDAVNFPKVIPRRFMYGSSDYSLNEEGVEEAVERLGPNGDKMDSRVWWDKE